MKFTFLVLIIFSVLIEIEANLALLNTLNSRRSSTFRGTKCEKDFEIVVESAKRNEEWALRGKKCAPFKKSYNEPLQLLMLGVVSQLVDTQEILTIMDILNNV